MAGLKPHDIDVAELYDAFTINTILFLEDLGFCNKGEGGSFVEDGAIAPGGRLPVNTNGGGLSCVHPGMYGIFTLIEAVSQLRNAAGDRQVAGAEIALCHGNGGLLSSQVTAILGSAATV
jgi:acetyl-CoA acetyltransferase